MNYIYRETTSDSGRAMSKHKVRDIINTRSMEVSKTTTKQEHSNREGKPGNNIVLPGRRAAKEEPPLMPKEQAIQVDDDKKKSQKQEVFNKISSNQINQWADNLLLSLAPEEKLMLLLHARRGQKRPLPASSQIPEQTENQFKKRLTRSFSACTYNSTRYNNNSNIGNQNQNQNPTPQSRTNRIQPPFNIPGTHPQHRYLSSQHQSSPGNKEVQDSTSLSSPPDFSHPIGGPKKSHITTKTLARPTMPTGFSSSLVRSLSDSASQASSQLGIALGETTKYQNAKQLKNSSFTFNTELLSTKPIYPIDPASSHLDFPCPVSRFRKPQNTTSNFARSTVSTAFSTPLTCYKNTNDQNAIPSSITFNSQQSSTTISFPKPQLRSEIPLNPTCQRKSLNLTGDAKGSNQNEGIKRQSNLSESHSSQSPTAGQEKSTIEKKLSLLRQQTKCMTDMLDSLCQAQTLISKNVPTREAPSEISSENYFRTQCLLAKNLRKRSDDQVSLNRSSFRASLLTKRASLMTTNLKVLSGESLEGECSRKIGQLASQKQSTKPHNRESERRSELASKNYYCVADGKTKENHINNTPAQRTTSCNLSMESLQDPSQHTYSQQFPGEIDLTLGLRMPLPSSDQETTATDNAPSFSTTSHHQNSPKIL